MTVDWILLVLRIAAPLLLYLFLARTIYQMVAWRTAFTLPVAHLRRLDQPEIVLSLQAITSLGRDTACTHMLESDQIALHHAAFSYQGSAWWVTGLEDAGDIAVNSRPVESPTPLTYGDIITLGDIALRLEQGG